MFVVLARDLILFDVEGLFLDLAKAKSAADFILENDKNVTAVCIQQIPVGQTGLGWVVCERKRLQASNYFTKWIDLEIPAEYVPADLVEAVTEMLRGDHVMLDAMRDVIAKGG